MSSETTHKCDRCGATGTQTQYNDREGYIQLWSVGFRFKLVGVQVQRYDPLVKEQEWCRECAAKFDFFVTRENSHKKAVAANAETTPFVPTTIDDLIREMVIEEIESSQQN